MVLTFWFCLILALVVIGLISAYDVWTFKRRGVQTTISWMLLVSAKSRPIVAVAITLPIGVLFGHFWWPQCPDNPFTTPKVSYPIQVHFSPHGGCETEMVREINSAKNEVLIQAYSFTSKPVASALIAAKFHGVDVKVIVDWKASQEKSCLIPELRKAKIPCWVDRVHPIAHAKICIVDSKMVVAGSWNFSSQAEKNSEDLFTVTSPDIVTKFRQNWLLHQKHSEAVK